MGVVQKPLVNMRGRVSSQLKTPFIATIAILFVLWSLLSLELPSPRSTVDKSLDLSPQSEHGAGIEESIPDPTSIPDPIESPVEGSEAVVEVIPTQPETKPVSERPLILYAYADSEEGTSLVNLKFFIEHGLHGAADFIFILNGETKTDVASLIPKEDNIRVVQRPNDCYDLGAYAEVLTKDDLYKGYKRFIMMNASLRGPFMPYWANTCWSDMYLSKITDSVKLVGMTANCWPTFHIQSMIWATDIIGLSILLFPPENALTYLSNNPITLPPAANKEDLPEPSPENSRIHQSPGINSCFHTWDSAVAAEISSTSLIKAAGYKVDAMMAAYHGMKEYYEEEKSCEENRDVLFDGQYFGSNVGVFETGFMKSNRDVDPVGLEKQSEWMKGRGYRSYDYCKV